MNFLASFLLRVRLAVVVLHAASLFGAVSAQMSLRDWVRRSGELRSALRTDDAADAAKVFVGVLFAHGDSMPIGFEFIGSDREVLIRLVQRSEDRSERLHVLTLLLWASRGATAEGAALRGLLGRRDVSDSERILRLAVVAEMSGSENREIARAILDGISANIWGNTESRRQALLVLGWMATGGCLVEVLPGLLESEGVLSDLDARALASGLCLRPEIELTGLAGIRVELRQLLGVYWNRISDRFSSEGLEIVSEEKPLLVGIAEAWSRMLDFDGTAVPDRLDIQRMLDEDVSVVGLHAWRFNRYLYERCCQARLVVDAWAAAFAFLDVDPLSSDPFEDVSSSHRRGDMGPEWRALLRREDPWGRPLIAVGRPPSGLRRVLSVGADGRRGSIDDIAASVRW